MVKFILSAFDDMISSRLSRIAESYGPDALVRLDLLALKHLLAHVWPLPVVKRISGRLERISDRALTVGLGTVELLVAKLLKSDLVYHGVDIGI